MQYDFLNDNFFTTYLNVESPKVTLNMPLYDEPLDISNWAKGVVNGVPVVKNNTNEGPKMIVNNNQELEIIYNDEPIVENSNPITTTKSTISKDLKGNTKIAYNFFINKGLKPHQAAGIVGNLIGESKLNSKALNQSSKAFGIALWLGDRKKKLFSKYGTNPSLEQLLEFVWEELNGTERKAFDKLLLTLSVEEATNSFMKHFERPSLREMALSITNRIKYAKSLG